MNADTFEGQWKQMRGELRSWWSKLTDNDLEKIGGKKDRLVGVLQEKYGYTRDAAQQEIDRRFKEYDERSRPSNMSRTVQTVGSTSSTPSTSAAGKADEPTRIAQEMAATNLSQPMSAVGEKIGSIADTIREKAPHEGAVGTAAATVADKLDAAGSYLQQKNLDHIMGDLSSVIRRYPIPSLLIGLGIGYLLAQGTRR
jgi:uncharacterized protein YjbJ (UPF0337 family)